MHGTAYVSVRSWVFLYYHSSGSIHGQADCLCFKGVWLFGPLFSCVKSGISLNSFYPMSGSAPPCPTLCGILISWSLIEPVYQLRRNSISVYICECKLYSGIQSMSILYLFTHLVFFNSPCYFVILEGLTHHLLGSDFSPLCRLPRFTCAVYIWKTERTHSQPSAWCGDGGCYQYLWDIPWARHLLQYLMGMCRAILLCLRGGGGLRRDFALGHKATEW